MALLASMLAYLGAATAIAVALLMATTVFLATPDQPTSTLQTLSDGVKANRTGGYDKCNNEADTHGRSMVTARSAAAFGQRDGFKNKGRRLYPPKAAYRECEFAKTISAYAGAARAHGTLG
jgi:hypothetical protein